MKGKILLQVEENGEAWYVHPVSKKRMFLGRPKDAFNVMRGQGVGITNNDLYKIPIGVSGGTIDSDTDGLSDYLETTIGLNPNNSDTDSDGYNDRDELLNGYSPWGVGRQSLDNNFADKQKGKILLQVEKSGEAWYVNPNDGRRYFLGRPVDAFNIMRGLGLGINNSDLSQLIQEEGAVNNAEDKPIVADDEQPSVIGENDEGYPIDHDKFYLHDPNDDYGLSIETICLTKKEEELARIINDYRESRGLDRIPVSKSLSYIEKVHILDQIQNRVIGNDCSLHSWSDKSYWKGCCVVVGKAETYACFDDKAEEFSNYSPQAFIGENASGFAGLNGFEHRFSPESTLLGWQASHGHNIVIVNEEDWKKYTWKALGVAMFNGLAYMLVGEETDGAGKPPLCSENNYQICGSIKNKNIQNECFYEKIISQTNYYDCENEKSELEKMNCQKKAEYSSDVCEQIGFFPVQQQKCYYEAAYLEKDHTLCDKIVDLKDRDSCYLKVAANINDPNICKNISSQLTKDDCYSHQEVEFNDINYCNQIVDPIFKNKCIKKVAVANKSIDQCSDITSESYKESCVEDICEMYQLDERRDISECFSDSAEKQADIDWCNNVSAGISRDYCFIGKAKDYNDFRVCDNIENSTNKDKCYSEFNISN